MQLYGSLCFSPPPNTVFAEAGKLKCFKTLFALPSISPKQDALFGNLNILTTATALCYVRHFMYYTSSTLVFVLTLINARGVLKCSPQPQQHLNAVLPLHKLRGFVSALALPQASHRVLDG